MSEAHLFSPIPIVHGLGPVATDFVAGILEEEKDLCQDALLSWRLGQYPTKLQVQLLVWWEYVQKAHAAVDPAEMDAVASWSVADVNAKLKEWGCDIRLSDHVSSGRLIFYLAALAQFTRRWKLEGEPGYWLPKARTKAFALTVERHGVRFGSYEDTPVVIVPVREGGWVFLTKATEPLSRFDLYARCVEIWRGQEEGASYSGAVLPYWKIAHHEVHVDPLCGLRTTDASEQDWWISQALMECDCSFGIDGTYFKAAFAAAMTRCALRHKYPGDSYVADHDVYYGIVDPNGRMIAAAYVPTGDFNSTLVRLER